MTRWHLSLLALLLGFGAAVGAIHLLFLNQSKAYDEVGLGVGTSSSYATVQGLPIHVGKFEEYGKLKQTLSKSAVDKEILLWLGNSQLHGVNQLKDGDRNSISHLHELLLAEGRFACGYSIPNANLQEHFVLFAFLSSEFPVKKALLPVFFDDTRETGLRGDVLHQSVIEIVKPLLDDSAFGASARLAMDRPSSAVTDADNRALHATTQEAVESILNKALNERSEIWRGRAEMRSTIIHDYLYRSRNAILGIKPTSKRKVIPANYRLNMEALERICDLAATRGIKLVVYIPPIRSDIEQPYVTAEYERFKAELGALKAKYRFDLVNAENVVPARYWGVKSSTTLGGAGLEVDFMHFQAEGHKLLADFLFRQMHLELKSK